MFDSRSNNLGKGGHEGKAAPTPSTRGRKKKNAAAGSSFTTSYSKMHRQQQQQQHHLYGQSQHTGHFGQRGGGGQFANQMPPPSMNPSLRHSTGMGLGLPFEEDSADFILDDLDRISPRNVAMARYKRNHELLGLIFDARRIDKLEPPPSPYVDVDQAGLKKGLEKLQEEMSELRESHSKRIKLLKEESAKEDVLLHFVKKGKGLPSAVASDPTTSDKVEQEESWAKEPSKGRIVGVGYVRTSTPEEVRELLPKAPAPVSSAPPAQVSTATTTTTTTTTAAAEVVPGDESQTAPLTTTTNTSTTAEGEQNVVAPPGESMESTIEAAQNILGGNVAMNGLPIAGEGTGQDVVDDDEDGEEDDDEDMDGDGDDDADDDDDDGQRALDGGEMGDADADEDTDADGDADDADAEDDSSAVTVDDSSAVTVEEPSTVEAIQKVKEEPSIIPTADLDTIMQEQPELESVIKKDTEEMARIEKERQLVEEVNRQHGVDSLTQEGPDSNLAEPAPVMTTTTTTTTSPTIEEPAKDTT